MKIHCLDTRIFTDYFQIQMINISLYGYCFSAIIFYLSSSYTLISAIRSFYVAKFIAAIHIWKFL